jgi:HK97 family phage major capsid protein
VPWIVVMSMPSGTQTTGDGSAKPEGWITSGTNAGTATAGTATQGFAFVAPFDLPKLFMSVAAPYRARGTWQVSTTAYRSILEWRDTDGVPIALPLADSPSGLGIYGRPLLENPGLAGIGSATKSFGFGAFENYVVARLPVQVLLSREAYVGSTWMFQTDQVALRVISRLDGKLLIPASVAYLVSAATWTSHSPRPLKDKRR